MIGKEWKEGGDVDGDTDSGSKIVLVESGGDDGQTLNICATFSAPTIPVCFDLRLKVFKDGDDADVSQRLKR